MESEKNKIKPKARILSLDGGGIRGIVPASILDYIEKELQRKTENSNARIADFFDMIVGTSTGGILACFYLLPNPKGTPSSKYDAQKALELYSKHGSQIFDESKKKSWFGLRQLFNATRYSAGNLERIFEETFGDTKHEDLLKPCIITSYDMMSGKAVFFNSHESGKNKDKRSFFVKDVARSTSAAPTYFPSASITNLATNEVMINLDGGVFANNPAMCAYAEARKTTFSHLSNNPPKAKDMLLLSVGTGSMPIQLKNIEKSKRWGIINWAKSVPEIMMDGGLDTVNHQMEMIFGSLGKENKKNYKRIDVPEELRFGKNNKSFRTPYNSDMSDASPRNIQDLLNAGQKTIRYANTTSDERHTLDKFIDLLIEQDKLINS